MKQRSLKTLSQAVESISILAILILSIIFFTAGSKHSLLLQIAIGFFAILFFINLFCAWKTYSVLSWKKSVRGRFYTSVAAAAVSLGFVMAYFIMP